MNLNYWYVCDLQLRLLKNPHLYLQFLLRLQFVISHLKPPYRLHWSHSSLNNLLSRFSEENGHINRLYLSFCLILICNLKVPSLTQRLYLRSPHWFLSRYFHKSPLNHKLSKRSFRRPSLRLKRYENLFCQLRVRYGWNKTLLLLHYPRVRRSYPFYLVLFDKMNYSSPKLRFSRFFEHHLSSKPGHKLRYLLLLYHPLNFL